MRIGMVTGEYPPMEGGVGAFTRELARAMADLGHEVHVLTRQQADGADEIGVHVAASVGTRWGWQTLRSIRKWALGQELAIVNPQFQTAAYNMHPAIHWLPSALRSTCPVVTTFHDLRAPYLFPKAGRVRAWIIRKLARDSTATIATDRADAAQLQRWSIAHVRWIPIGSNVRRKPPANYDRAAWRKRLGVAPNELLISHFGFLNESKGGLALVEALARLVAEGVPAHLVMIGGRAGASDPTNFAYGERVDKCIASNNLEERVHWTGFVNEEEVSANFLASDVTALPYQDGVSLRRGTLMAALVHGRAIVTTTPQTNAPELDGALVTVSPADSGALAKAIFAVWQDEGRRKSLEDAALKTANLFGWNGIAKQTLAFYEELLGGSHSKSVQEQPHSQSL